MKDLPLSEMFRFLLSGVVVLLYLYIFDQELASSLVESFGDLELILVALVVGSILYHTYRALVYTLIINRIQDVLRIRSDNYRTYLRKQYGSGPQEANQIWSDIRDTQFSELFDGLTTYAAGIHYVYLSAILALPYAILEFANGETIKGYLFLVIFFLLFVTAFLNDRHYEDREFRLLKSVDQSVLDRFAARLGGQAGAPESGSA